MSDVFFVDGIPAKIERSYFRARFGSFFPDLLPEAQDSFLDTLIDDTYTMFAGVGTIWRSMSQLLYYDKTQQCYATLVAWYIADMYPMYAIGIPSTSGLPIKSKVIGGIKITFEDTEKRAARSTLEFLRSNKFGVKAYQMITSSTAKARILGR